MCRFDTKALWEQIVAMCHVDEMRARTCVRTVFENFDKTLNRPRDLETLERRVEMIFRNWSRDYPRGLEKCLESVTCQSEGDWISKSVQLLVNRRTPFEWT